MSDLYAIVRDRLVSRVIVADASFVAAQRDAAAAGKPSILEPGDQIIGSAPESCASGWSYDQETGVFSAPPSAEPPVADLVAVKASAVAAINAAAERAFNVLMPPGRVQVLLEQARQAEALTAAGPMPEAFAYPLLAANIGPWGDDLAEVVMTARANAAEWRTAAGAIEAVRASGQRAVVMAEDVAAVEAALAAVAWP